MKKVIHIFIRILGWLVLSLVVLVTAVLLLVQTSPVKSKIARIAEDQASQYLNARLSIGKLEGNFWTNLSLNKLAIIGADNDTIATIESLKINYKLRALLQKRVNLRSIEIEQPSLKLVQLADSTWNVAHLVRESESDTTASEASSSDWVIDLQKLVMKRGSIRILSPDTIIPKQIDSLNINLSAYYSESFQQLQLDSLSLATLQPDFGIKKLQFSLKRQNSLSTLSDFKLTTRRNRLSAEAKYDETRKKQSTIDLNTAPINWDEFTFILPELNWNVNPELEWTASLQSDSLTSQLELRHKNQQIKLQVKSPNFYSWLSNPDSVSLDYRLTANLDKIKLSEWSGQKDLDYLLNGSIVLSGSGLDPKKLNAGLQSVFTNSNIAGYQLDNFQITADYSAGDLTAELQMQADFGQLEAKGTLKQLFGNPVYSALLNVSQLNLAPVTGDDSLKSNINFKAEASGSGFDPKTLSAHFKLNGSRSAMMNMELDTAFAEGSFTHQVLKIDSLFLRNQSLIAQASGTYSLTGVSDIRLAADLLSLDAFKAFLPEADIRSRGKLEARVSGSVDSLKIAATAKLNESSYDDFRLKSIELKADGSLLPDNMQFNTQISGEQFTSSIVNLDSILLDSKIFADSLQLNAAVSGNELHSYLAASLSWSEEIRLRLESWQLTAKNQNWNLESPAKFEMDSTGYRLQNFSLHSDKGQSLAAGGIFSQTGQENFNLKIEKLNLGELLQSFDADPGLAGQLNLDLNLAGTAAAPIIDGSFRLDSAGIAGYHFSKAEGDLKYQAGQLALNSELRLAEQGEFSATGRIPVRLNLQTFASSFSPDDKVDVRIELNNLPLNLLSSVIPAKEIKGMLNGEVVVNGSMNTPNPSGFVKLEGGKILMPEYGVDYRDMQFTTRFDNKIISLDTLAVSSKDGYLSGTGDIDFASEFYKGDITNSNIKIKFSKFNPIDLRQLNMQLNGDASLSGTKGAVVFGGNLVVPQSEIDLTTAMNMFGKVYTPELQPSILMAELEKQQHLNDSLLFYKEKTLKNDSSRFSYFDKLTGKINLKIPKNTWIKNPNLRIEISGDLQILKNTRYAEIFGTVSVVRGQYELFGRTFIVSEGEISFQGGEEINPTVNLTATYTIKRQNSSSQTLKLIVEGESLSPKISFTLDNESITEGDALSYIVFGKAINELSSSQQSDVASAGTESMAKSAAASLLASQLTKLLGNSLNVDYIEVKSQSDFDNASLEVGKYLTNDLFISYEQQFGSSSDNDLSRYQVRLEYEILRFLFLQLNNSTNDSGFDIIFKIRAK